jgi:hypothetical protein
MSFWNEAFYFEKRGDRYVYRPTVFSAGFDISESEKDHLFRDMKRLQWRFLFEGTLLIALIAGLFMTAVIESRAPVHWFMFVSVVALAALAMTVLYRRDRLIARVLGHRKPDVPRLPFKQTLAKPRPLVSKRFAIPVLQSVTVLLGLAIAVGDALVLYVIAAAYRSRQIAQGPEDTAAVEELFSLTSSNVGFWVVVALFNAVLVASIVFSIRQVRHLRATPDLK